MPLRWLTSLLAALWLLAAPPALAEVAVPPLQARVTDLTGTLSASERSSLESTLQAFEAKKGSQIAVLLVPTTQPETVEQFAIRVAEAWKLGRKGVDDGVLLLVAKNDRKLRIEVGYGLEGVIPDAVAKRVISEVITPYFKQGDFSGGVRAGVEQLISLIESESLSVSKTQPLPAQEAQSLPEQKAQSVPVSETQPTTSSDEGGSIWTIVFMGIGLLILIAKVLGGWWEDLAGSAIIGAIVSLFAWPFTLFFSPWYTLGAGLAVFGFLLSRSGRKVGSVGRGGRSSGGGGWSSGGGSWSSSSGGFSGGGGSFGGGGASGDW